jgi:hypothetical protein
MRLLALAAALASSTVMAQGLANNCQPNTSCTLTNLVINGDAGIGGNVAATCFAPPATGSNLVVVSITSQDKIDLNGGNANGVCGGAGAVPIYYSGSNGITLGSGQVVLVPGNGGLYSSATAGNLAINIQNAGALLSLKNLANNIYAETSGNSVFNQAAAGLGYMMQPARRGVYQTNASGDTSLTAIGLPAHGTTCTGACTPANDVTDTNYTSMILFPTVATTGDSCGDCNGPFTMTRPSSLPMIFFVVRTDPAAITTVRYYIGISSAGLDQVSTLAGANAIRNCTFRFDTGIGDTNWMAESSDGTTASATDTTVAVASATTYLLGVDMSVASECDFYINGVKKVAKTTNPPAGTTLMAPYWSVTTLANAVRNISASQVVLQQK